MRELLKSWTGGRGFIAAVVIAGILALVERFSLIPAYRAVTGFTPFDVQFPLSHFMVGVELGAFDKAAARGVYIAFAAVDAVYQLAVAGVFTLLWMWLFARAPMALVAFLRRGGILMVPTYAVLLDLVTKAGFVRLLQGPGGADAGGIIEFSVTVHRLAFAVADIRNILTAVFLALAVGVAVRRRRVPEGASFTS